MTKIKNKIMSFPRPPEEQVGSTIIFQVGNDRFAIHWEIEELPPATPLVRLKRIAKRGTSVKIVDAGQSKVVKKMFWSESDQTDRALYAQYRRPKVVRTAE